MATRTYTYERHCKAGLPRPIEYDNHDVLRPVPWSQEGYEDRTRWGVIDDRRHEDSVLGSLCLVCGAHVGWGFVIANISKTPAPTKMATFNDLGRNWVADGGPLHGRCLKLTRAHCRSVREDYANGVFCTLPYLDTRHVTA